MPIRSDLELDISQALEAVGTLQEALTSAFQTAAASLSDAISSALGEVASAGAATLAVNVDTTGIDQALSDAFTQTDSGLIVPVSADTTTFSQDVAGAETQAEATPAVVPVTADTSAADQAIADINAQLDALNSGTASETGGGGASAIGALAGATTGLGIANDFARGSTVGLAAALGNVSTGAAEAVAGVVAVGEAVKVLTEDGLRGVAAQQRLNLVFGDTAKAIEQINIGGLSGQIGDLAIKAGSSAQSIEQANANLGFLAHNSGLTDEQTKTLTQDFSALALQAVAVKPALGDAGTVMDQLVPALSRGGRSALQFGLSLSSAEINARAMADTGITTASALTTLEKALAGAEIATENLGNKIGTNFSQGIQQTQVQFKSLGAEIQQTLVLAGEPLVAPALELFKALTPVAEEFGKSLGTIAGGVVAAVGPLVSDLAPAATLVAEALTPIGGLLKTIGDLLGSSVGQGVVIATTAFFGFSAVVNTAETAVRAIGAALATIDAEGIGTFVAGLGSGGTAIGAIFTSIAAESEASVTTLDTSLAEALASIGAFSSTGEALLAQFAAAVDTEMAAALASMGLFESEAAAMAALAQAELDAAIAETEATDAVLLSNPITAIVVGVAAVVAGIAAAISSLGDSAKAAAPVTSQLADSLDKVKKSADGASLGVVDLTQNLADAIANNNLGDLGKQLTQNSDKLLTDLGQVGVSVSVLGKDLTTGTTGLTSFTESLTKITPNTDVFVSDFNKIGVSTKTVIEGLAQGRDLVSDFATRIRGSAAGFDSATLIDYQDHVEKVTKALRDEQTTLDASAKTKLLQLEIDGQLTSAQSGQLDHLLTLTDAQGGFNALLVQANAGLSDQSVGLDRNTAAWSLLAQAVGAGAISTDSSSTAIDNLATQFGVSDTAIIQFIADVQDADQKLTDTFVKHLPAVGDALTQFIKDQVHDFGLLQTASTKLTDQLAADQLKQQDNATTNADAIQSALARRQQANEKLATAEAKQSTAGENATTQASAASQIAAAHNAVASAQNSAANASLAYQKVLDEQAKQGKKDADQIVADQKKVAEAAKNLATDSSPEQLLKNINAQTEGISHFQTNVDTIINTFHDPRLAEELVQLGVTQGGALADQIIKNGPGAAKNIEAAIANNDKAQQAITDDFKTNWVGKFSDAATTIAEATAGKLGFTLTTQGTSKVSQALDSIRAVFGADSPQFQSFLAQVSESGGAVSEAFVSSILGSFNNRQADIQKIEDQIIESQKAHHVPINVSLALQEATHQVDSEASLFGSDNTISGIATNLQSGIEKGINTATANAAKTAQTTFAGLGSDFIDGIVTGLQKAESQKKIKDAAAGMVFAAEQAARVAAAASSPSKLFAALGSDLIDGLAQGISDDTKTLLSALDTTMAALNTDAVTRGTELGRDLGIGIETGLLTTLAPLFDAIDRVLTQTEKHARATVKASSPSQLFADLGKDIAAGLALGIDTSASSVSEAAQRAVKSAHTAADLEVRKSSTDLRATGSLVVAPPPLPELRSVAVTSHAAPSPLTADTVQQIAKLAAAETAKANKPISITHHESVDPLHVAAEVAWSLTH